MLSIGSTQCSHKLQKNHPNKQSNHSFKAQGHLVQHFGFEIGEKIFVLNSKGNKTSVFYDAIK